MPDYSAIRDAVPEGEAIGADVVFNWDHFFPLYGDARGKHFDAGRSGSLGESTTQIEIGALVTQLLSESGSVGRHGPYRGPYFGEVG